MIYVFDLDGTLCRTPVSDGRNLYLQAEPYCERVRTVNALYRAGNRIVINTARGCASGKDWGPETERQLAGWGLRYHELRTGSKPCGDVFVDDRAVNAARFFGADHV